jgi:hypothetical protein
MLWITILSAQEASEGFSSIIRTHTLLPVFVSPHPLPRFSWSSSLSRSWRMLSASIVRHDHQRAVLRAVLLQAPPFLIVRTSLRCIAGPVVT